MRHTIAEDTPRKGEGGFTLMEVLIVAGIIGILGATAILSTSAYRLKAEYSAIQTTLRFIMDAEEIYYLDNDEFYPQDGTIEIPQGTRMGIPEINYTFPSGHKHRYLIYGLNRTVGGSTENHSYITIYSDFDFNYNGTNDMFVAVTEIQNGEKIFYRQINQYQ